jgi:cell division protein FtsN
MASKQRRPSGHATKQSGGTFLGVVLGLIVGLAIAVVVALYITHSPTPFVSRTPTPASGTAAATDPNRPLAGATPGLAVPQSAQPTPPNTAPGQPSNPSTGLLDEPKIVEVPQTAPAQNYSTTPPAPVRQGSSPSSSYPGTPSAPANRPVTAPAANPSAPAHASSAPAPATAPGDANTGYFLQVGAYRTEGDADQQRARLALMGYEGKVTRRDSGAVTFFRVRIGPFSKFDDMNSARQRLSGAGIDTAVIRFTRQ